MLIEEHYATAADQDDRWQTALKSMLASRQSISVNGSYV